MLVTSLLKAANDLDKFRCHLFLQALGFHLLLHLVYGIRRLGPVRGWWMFFMKDLIIGLTEEP